MIRKKFRKWASIMLASAMIFQQGGIVTYAESETTQEETVRDETASKIESEKQSEEAAARAKAESERQSEEAAAKAESERQSEEAAAKAESERQSEEAAAKAESERQSEEAAAKAESEKQSEEAAAKAESERQSEEAAAKAESEKQSEAAAKAESEKAAEAAKKEYEKTHPANNGEKITSGIVENDLNQVLDFLIAANTITGDLESEELEDILGGEEAVPVLNDLKAVSRKYAKAKSSAEVEVIQLFADANGVIDTKPLEKLYSNKKIDVTHHYVLVNIAAADPQQELSFSGFELTYKENPVVYDNLGRVGYVLYNFTAVKDGAYTDFEGTVRLSSENGLKGTFLAPAGTVILGSDLTGTVYADEVKAEGTRTLRKVVLIRGRDLEAEAKKKEAEAAAEIMTEAVTEPAEEVTEAPTEVETEETTEVPTEAETEEATEVPTEAETEETTEEATELVTEEATEVPTEAETEEVTEVPTEVETEETTEVPTEAETEETTEEATELVTEEATEVPTEAETEEATEVPTEAVTEQAEEATEAPTELVTEEATEAPTEIIIEEITEVPDAEEASEHTNEPKTEEDFLFEESIEEMEAEEIISESLVRSWYSDAGAVLRIQLVDAKTQLPVSGGEIEVHTAEDIFDIDDKIVYAKDDIVTSFAWEDGETAEYDIGKELKYSGRYYVDITEVPAGYLSTQRVYFMIDLTGAVVPAEISGWKEEEKLLSCSIYPAAEAVSGYTTIRLNGGAANISGAAFAVKDGDGNLICDADGYPLHYAVIHAGSSVLRDLPAGNYYLTQIHVPEGYLASEDIPFVVTDDQNTTVDVENVRIPDQSNTLGITLLSAYNNTLLTAEKDSRYYFALFKDKELTKKVTGVCEVVLEKGQETAEELLMKGLNWETTYYLAETDEFGTAFTNAASPDGFYVADFYDVNKKVSYVSFKPERKGSETEETGLSDPEPAEKHLALYHNYKVYPEKDFSYYANIVLTKKVQNEKKESKKVTETFYVALFEDQKHTRRIDPVLPLEFKNQDKVSIQFNIKMTSGSAEYYAAEVDANGNVLTSGNENYQFAISYEDKATGDATGKLTIACGETAGLTVTNTLSKAVVKISVQDPSGKLIPGAELVLKNEKQKVVSVNGEVIFKSEGKVLEWKGVLPEGTYYLSEVNAPDGYTPAPDLCFTVETGKITDAVLVNEKASGTGSAVVSFQVYEGENLLYAQDTTTGTNQAKGLYTRYVALFSDKERTQKVSNVQQIDITGFQGTTEFKNLKTGVTYYVAETDRYGQVLTSTDAKGIMYANGGAFSAGSSAAQVVVSNVYTKLPDGFRYTARLVLEKKVQDTEGAAKNVNDTFYIGIFRTSDFSDTPTLVKMEMKNTSSAQVSKRILLSGENDVTYYFAEVDQTGKKVTASAEFGYNPQIDRESIVLKKSAEEKVVVTNKERVSKVTLYLTKRVYDGSNQKSVTKTFYAGLFKDPEFKELYANPIPLKLENSSSVTLKLALNMGTAAEATIYVAEVDQKGNVVKSGKEFGYDIKLINATAAFNQERTEIQSIILNSVAGSSNSADWNDILSHEDNLPNHGGGYNGNGGYISNNGEASEETVGGNGEGGGSGSSDSNEGVKTGDETPWEIYIGLLAASAIALVLLAVTRKKRKNN